MSSGNTLSHPGYPGRYATDYGICVGAVDQTVMMSFSNKAGDTTWIMFLLQE